ncbi:hypothetical protein, partial [Mesorhizobium sp. M0500]|uniref:hypothetical protein n=1 Tax=Mesorhizobium sp. M0500 TaxID=2956953 RepID=UPI00333A919D
MRPFRERFPASPNSIGILANNASDSTASVAELENLARSVDHRRVPVQLVAQVDKENAVAANADHIKGNGPPIAAWKRDNAHCVGSFSSCPVFVAHQMSASVCCRRCVEAV